MTPIEDRPARPKLEAIRARLDAATDGPWFIEHHGVMTPTRDYTVVLFGDSDQDSADAEFIASAPDDITYLLAIAEAARAYVALYLEREEDPHARYAHGPIREAHKKLIAAVKEADSPIPQVREDAE